MVQFIYVIWIIISINPDGVVNKDIYKNHFIDNYTILIDEKGNYKWILKKGKEEGKN